MVAQNYPAPEGADESIADEWRDSGSELPYLDWLEAEAENQAELVQDIASDDYEALAAVYTWIVTLRDERARLQREGGVL